MELDYGWWEFVYDDIKEVGAHLGLDIEDIFFGLYPHDVQLRATYRFPGPEAALLILHHYPSDRELQAIAGDLHDAQPERTTLSAKITPCGQYASDYEIYADDYEVDEPFDEEGLENALKRFSRWCLNQIQAEYDYLSDLEEEHDEEYDNAEVEEDDA